MPSARPPRDVLVLCYHAVADEWPDPLAVGAAELEQQIARLLRRGWRPATFTQAVTAPPARRTLAVTFDDGFRSVLDRALPVLERLGVPATAFVPTAYVEGGRLLAWSHLDRWLGGPHEHELQPMSWSHLRTLQDRGWEIGSHTVSHPHLTALDDASLDAELHDSKTAIESLGAAPCRALAYPYGDADPRVAAAARGAGYEAAASVIPLARPGDRWRFPRVPAGSGEGPLAQRMHTWRAVRRLQSLPGWPVAQRLAGRRSRPS